MVRSNDSQADVELEKERLRQRILMALARACSGNPDTCILGRCKFNGTCAKQELTYENLPKTKVRLKGLVKNLAKKENRANGITNPNDFGQTLIDRCSIILGQHIFEHPLVKGNQNTISRIRTCKTVKQVLTILHTRSKFV